SLILHSFSPSIFFVYTLICGYITRKLADGRPFIISTYSISSKVIIVTGATSGIGRVAAVELARIGAKVIVGIRGQERAEKIAKLIAREAKVSQERIIGYHLDLSDLSVVKTFAEHILQTEHELSILLNNAATIQYSHSLTAQGFEIHFGTNHLGQFYLTQLLLPLLIKSKARVVNLSSMAHCSIDDKGIDYAFPSSPFHSFHLYSQSKLANIWHTVELNRRYGDRGLTVVSLHPGTIMTELSRELPKIFAYPVKLLFYLVAKTEYQGALTSLYCCLSDHIVSGQFYADVHPALSSPLANDKQLAKECWEFSEKAIKGKNM
ncbi:unnamed protein product, partial [Didymodactylos carnosus]